MGVLPSHGLIKIQVRYINVKTYIILNLRSTSLSVSVCPVPKRTTKNATQVKEVV